MRTLALAFTALGRALLLELAAAVTSRCRLRRRCSVWGLRIVSCRRHLLRYHIRCSLHSHIHSPRKQAGELRHATVHFDFPIYLTARWSVSAVIDNL